MTWLAAQKSNKGVRQSGAALLSDLEARQDIKQFLTVLGMVISVKKMLGDDFGVTILT
jgi:arabinogalactan oligomer/maltooligosaccharide transport system substrate-binding protein